MTRARPAAAAGRAAGGGPRARGEAGRGGLAELRPVPARGAAARRARARGSSRPALPEERRVRARGAGRRGAHPRRVDRAAAAALLRVHRVQRARDRRDRATCSRTRTTSTWRSTRAPRRGSSSRRCGGSASSSGYPAADRRVHERRHDLQRHRARRGPRAGAAGLAHRGARRAAAWRSTARPRCTTRSPARSSCSGIGSANLRDAADRRRHRMRADALAEAIERDVADGITPVAVVATAGTTLTGAIDPIGEIADVCARARRLAARRRRVRPAGRRRGVGARPVRRARARRLGQRRRAQVALPAEGLRRRAGARRARSGATRSRTRRATCRTSGTSCTPSTSPSSTRGRSGR